MDWPNFFVEMPDFRVDRRKKHHLVDILVIALCALISGSDDFEEIAAYGRRKEAFLRTFLPLAKGIPSHDTFTRVFRHMDTAAFGRCLYAWSAQALATAPAADFNRYIRQHWRIENGLHWKLDVVFREDRQRTRCDNGPLNLATARKLALQTLNQATDAESMKNRRKMAGWDDDYLRSILTQMAPI